MSGVLHVLKEMEQHLTAIGVDWHYFADVPDFLDQLRSSYDRR